MTGPNVRQTRFVLQRGPDSAAEPCGCGSPFAVVTVAGGTASLRCMDCDSALDASMVRFHEIAPLARRSPGHPPCPSWSRVVVPKVREDVNAAAAIRLGAERWDLFCVACGDKDGSVPKDTLRGFRTVKRRDDDNQHQRTEVLERAGGRCDLCFRPGLPRDVGHCLSKSDADAMGVPREVRESLWNKCALCLECNQASHGGYGAQSMSPSAYCGLLFTREEARKMLDFGAKGPVSVDPTFYRIYSLLRQRRLDRSKEAA